MQISHIILPIAGTKEMFAQLVNPRFAAAKSNDKRNSNDKRENSADTSDG